MTELFLVVLTLLAILILLVKKIFTGIVFLAVFSLVNALLFFYLHAPDLAIAEAAVGAGLSTAVFVYAFRKTEARDDQ